MANRSPPMPLPVGSIRPNAALAAIAASTAEPPALITSSATWVASGWEVAAIACGACTSLRVAKGWPVMRSAAWVAGTVANSRAARRRRGCRDIRKRTGDGGSATLASPPRVRPRLNRGGGSGPLAADSCGTAPMLHARLGNDSTSALHLRGLQPSPPPPAPPEAANAPALQPLQGRHEPGYHPQLGALSPAAPQGPQPQSQSPQCAPGGVGPGELSALASGQQAQEFDVVLSQLATAVYGMRGAPPAGWTEVTDADLAARGIDDPAAWRAQYLDRRDQTGR